jgi:hypothetical protein
MDRVSERLSSASIARRKKRASRRSAEFLRGPIPVDWLAAASGFGAKSLTVGLAIWFRAGIEGRKDSLKLCRATLERFAVNRLSGYRGVIALEDAGLLSVVRNRGQCPVVTILPTKRQRKGGKRAD